MTWISAHKPQRKILCVYAGPHIQPAQRPCRRGREAAAQPGQIGPERGEPAHPLSPACVWWGERGVPPSVWRGGHLRGPSGPARPCPHPPQLERSPIERDPLRAPLCLGTCRGRQDGRRRRTFPAPPSVLSLFFSRRLTTHANAKERCC